jgi:hypothetical protein
MPHSLLKQATSWLQALLTKVFEFGMCKHSVRSATFSIQPYLRVHIPTACSCIWHIYLNFLDIYYSLNSIQNFKRSRLGPRISESLNFYTFSAIFCATYFKANFFIS